MFTASLGITDKTAERYIREFCATTQNQRLCLLSRCRQPSSPSPSNPSRATARFIVLYFFPLPSHKPPAQICCGNLLCFFSSAKIPPIGLPILNQLVFVISLDFSVFWQIISLDFFDFSRIFSLDNFIICIFAKNNLRKHVL